MLDPDQLTYVHRTWQVPSEVDSATQPPNWEMFVDGLAEHGSAYDSTNRLHLQGTNRFRYLNSIAAVYQSSAQTGLAVNAWQTITFTSENTDTDTLHSTVSNTSRITVPIAGKWLFVGGLSADLTGVTSPTRELARLIKNGGAVSYGFQNHEAVVSGANHAIRTMVVMDLAANDYMELQGFVVASSGTWASEINDCTLEAFYVGE